jgi:hypothetical protein
VAANSTQRYTWKAAPAAVWYELYVTRNGSILADKWFALSNSVVDSATGNFAVDVSGHGSGAYQWWVRGWSPDGFGTWSGSLSFEMPLQPPGATTLRGPAGVVSESAPTFRWDTVGGATWYQVWINKEGQYYYSTWVQGTTNWTPSWDMQQYPGSYEWCVRTWNSDGYGPWSQSAAFTIPAPLAPASLSGKWLQYKLLNCTLCDYEYYYFSGSGVTWYEKGTTPILNGSYVYSRTAGGTGTLEIWWSDGGHEALYLEWWAQGSGQIQHWLVENGTWGYVGRDQFYYY